VELDNRWPVAARLLAGSLRDFLPVLYPARASLFVEFDDTEIGPDGAYRVHAQLGRFLDYEVHRVAFYQRLDERHGEPRLRQRRQTFAESQSRVSAGKRLYCGEAFLAHAVEHDDIVARL
jgi:hypothetical protein